MLYERDFSHIWLCMTFVPLIPIVVINADTRFDIMTVRNTFSETNAKIKYLL